MPVWVCLLLLAVAFACGAVAGERKKPPLYVSPKLLYPKGAGVTHRVMRLRHMKHRLAHDQRMTSKQREELTEEMLKLVRELQERM